MEESGNKLKPWREMTDAEIRKTTKEKCQYCIYSRKLTFGLRCDNVIMCAYILVEKKGADAGRSVVTNFPGRRG